jgi:hypothetical protein
LPQGHANDLARAFNGRVSSPEKILAAPTIDFHPLEISIDGVATFYVGAYAGLGAISPLADWLNSGRIREFRQRFSRVPILVLSKLRGADLREVVKLVNQVDLPDFESAGQNYRRDNIGFLLTSVGGGAIRLRQGDLISHDRDFFFHSEIINRHKNNKSGIPKLLMVGKWAVAGLPGGTTSVESLRFKQPFELDFFIGGDTVPLGKIQQIDVKRSRRSIKVLAPKNKLSD